MSARYGDRTRSGDAVSQGGRRAVVSAGGGGQSQYEETFTAPGTWTWPGNVTHVEVLLVGGGGGAGANVAPPSPAGYSGAGGGGGVRMVYDIPVTAPVPITVGSGGAGGTYPGGNGSAGGDSAFGPIASPIPPSTYKVGGGGGGYAGSSVPPASLNAPPDGGGAGGLSSATGVPVASRGLGGQYGMPTYGAVFAPAPVTPVANRGVGAGSRTSAGDKTGGLGFYGFGMGGRIDHDSSQTAVVLIDTHAHPTAISSGANSGMGGAPKQGAGTSPGQAGASGTVIVRWWE